MRKNISLYCVISLANLRLDRVPKFVSAKIAGCKHPVKRKTNDLSKLKYCQSDFKKIVFLRGG